MSIDDLLRSLSENEKKVLYYKSKGLKYEQISVRLGYSLDWVQLQMSNVYLKLGFEKSMHWTKRRDILENDVYPKIPKELKEWLSREDIPEPNKPKEEPSPNSQIMALVLYDEMAIEEAKSRTLQKIPPNKITIIPKPNPIIHKTRNLILFILVLGAFSAVGYFAYNFGRGATVTQILVITATPQLQQEASLLSPTYEILTTETLSPTLTPLPSITPISTETAIPTPTVFIPPVDGILFQDNFDETIKPEWTQSSGTWIVVNGRLTMVADDNLMYTDRYNLITLRDLGWNNYILSIDVYIPSTNSNEQTAVIIRTSGSGEIGFVTDNWPNIYMAFIGQGYSNSDGITSNRDGVSFPEGVNTRVEMEVQNDTYILRFNGKEIQRITIPGYNKNLIQIGLNCSNSYIGCALFDNVKVTYLP